jgi:outer membrane protein OmpA-like peptidoglycan-associated protein
MKMQKIKLPMTLLALAVLAGCSSVPEKNNNLENARLSYANALTDPQVSKLASMELKEAAATLRAADEAWSAKHEVAEVDHLAYTTQQRVALAQQIAKQKATEAAISDAKSESDKIRLAARTKEAELAKRKAEQAEQEAAAANQNASAAQLSAVTSQMDAENAQRQAQASQQSAEESQRLAAEAQRQREAEQQNAALVAATAQREVEASKQAAAAAQAQTEAAQRQAQEAELRASQLTSQLQELNAKKTERGLVVTLGDVLFDSGKAQLKTGGLRNIQKLSEALKQSPKSNVLVEGFTDSTGTDETNQMLSERRANAVKTALVEVGVSPDRIKTQGYGKAFPVADNGNAAGRQMNRRVEIIISDESGNIAPR